MYEEESVERTGCEVIEIQKERRKGYKESYSIGKFVEREKSENTCGYHVAQDFNLNRRVHFVCR